MSSFEKTKNDLLWDLQEEIMALQEDEFSYTRFGMLDSVSEQIGELRRTWRLVNNATSTNEIEELLKDV